MSQYLARLASFVHRICFEDLEQEAAREASKEERVNGYRVKVEYQPVTEGEKRVRREAVGQVILQGLRRLKNKEPTE